MSFLKKIFGGGDTLATVRKAYDQGRWAEALAAGDGLHASLDAQQASELEALLNDAGDKLALWNMQEGRAYLEAGDRSLASDHFSLAQTHARSVELRNDAEAALTDLRSSPQPVPAAPVLPPEAVVKQSCASGCCGGPTSEEPTDNTTEDLDPDTRLELLLVGFPPELAERYAASDIRFKEACLLSHEESREEALACFDAIQEPDRDDLFYFERGSLLARKGETSAAFADLEQAVAINPVLELAWEVWVDLKLSDDQGDEAKARLTTLLAAGASAAFCHARLAALEMHAGNGDVALQHGLKAMELGDLSASTVSLCALLLERAGRDEEAEQLLTGLGGGCCGGVNVQLAEFWLRRNRHLDRVLESFKGALREDPTNPRWPLRISQVYLARGWVREGIALLEQALADSRLDEVLRQEGVALLEANRSV
ncbi:MAG TPA: hypothetical protein VJ955_01130 [Desulfuromonadales bacterium]|nr:hypothetical protein [Desulfuromonadales bacterium]